MANPFVNKVIVDGVIRLDLSSDTVTADKILSGYTAHDKSGKAITGTYTPAASFFTVTIKAPKNSTVSYTGASSGSVSMGSLETATLALITGTYTFTNTLLLVGSTRTLFSITVAVVGNMSLNLYPSGAIYWYGLNLYGLEKLNSGTLTLEDNDFQWVSGTAGTGRVLINTNAFVTSSSSTLFVKYDQAGGRQSTVGFVPANSTTAVGTAQNLPTPSSGGTIHDFQFQLTNEQKSKDLRIRLTNSSGNSSPTIYYAIWLE